MLKSILLIAAFVGCTAVLNAQLITNFGNTATNDGIGWTYTPATSQLSGTEVIGSYLYGIPINSGILGATALQLTMNVTTDPFSNFTVTLEDNVGKLAISHFSWSNFVGGATVATIIIAQPNFNYNNIAYWSLDSGSSGNEISATLNKLEAVPEPATWMLLAGSMTTVMLLRRRRNARA